MSRWRNTKKGKVVSTEDISSSTNDNSNDMHATTLSRAKAFVTDSFMIIMPLMYFSIYFVMGGRELFEQNMTVGWSIILIPYLIITVLFTVIKGQTPGFKAYEIKVVDNRTHTNINLFTATLRFILFILSIVSIVGMLVPFFRKDGKTIQDLLTSTAVINFPNKQ